MRVIKIIFIFILTACTQGGLSTKANSVSNSTKTVEIVFSANKETAVKTRGGYKVYVGASAGFLPVSALKVVDVPGTAEVSGKIQVSVSGLSSGIYYAKTQAYSDLVDPNIGTSAVSSFSDEVSFSVP